MSGSRGRGRTARLLAVLAALTMLFSLSRSLPASADPVLGLPPTSTSVSQRATMAVLTWPAVAGATGYAVEYGTDPGFATVVRATTADTILMLTGLTPTTTYYLHVATWDAPSNTTGDWGQGITFTTSEEEFALPPLAVSAVSDTSTSIRIDWSEPASGLTYEVAFGTDPTHLSETRQVKDAYATFTKLKTGRTYYASVRALTAARVPVTAWSAPIAQETPDSLPLRVGTYNIMCANCSKGKAPWSKRRGPMVDAIRGQDLDVLGVQEASIGRVAGGGSQYMDLVKRLGSPYKLTEYGRKASPDNRIIYNSTRIKLVKQGVIRLPASRRFMAWAILEQKSTGKRFLFTDTHLDPRNTKAGRAADRRQSKTVVAAIARLKKNLPVIAVGDYASTKWEKGGNAPYNIMQAAGYKDPLGNAYRSRNSAPGAFVETRIHTSYASLNMYKRKARNFSGDVNGSNTDYIFVTPMRVSEYEVVVKVDSAGRFIGVIPSDHNLLRATVYLP